MSNLSNEDIVKVENLTKIFGSGKKAVKAVDNVTFSIKKGEIVSLVGQSGSGKTTVTRLLLRLLKETEGKIIFEGQDITGLTGKEKKLYWKKVQAIFQDPYASFNIFAPVKKVLIDAFKLFDNSFTKQEKMAKVYEALESVNLRPEEVADKYPFELSGGQRQRIMIARAHLIKPKLLLADEPTSMIDANLRSGILELLLGLRDTEGTTIMFVTHDLGLAYYVSDRLFIMHEGKIVERGDADKVITHPEHPYTKQLMMDVPKLSEEWVLK
ncbi:peptide ABC transporter ATPase [Petrotoga sp. HKA.pet.4.5]|uniref:ABC transporter ATP-binding protein n=1 Tax=unclassified Petrotoga TaxID=2620614 RepID=UPI000EF1434F|nr:MULTISPECIES: ABC transporter ATP-binding protein [unclassified Petrotoga]RLL83797.1 peptide ABC transporter ATPase [Petrotoga sp. Shatin.DS.tank11.9.2.9.3]RLL90108.1 peptide ABC transporter ATPase [Petrotoga sp. HKA.pet.4.5]